VTTNSLVEVFIASAHLAEDFGSLGSLRTTNFSYAFGKGRRLTYIIRLTRNGSPDCHGNNEQFRVTTPSVDTNGACKAAVRCLQKVFIDLQRLTNSCTVLIYPWVAREVITRKYTVEWYRPDKNDMPVAEVTVAGPRFDLWTLRIEEPDLIFRPPLPIDDAIKAEKARTEREGR
jgi:hypothetical protein